MNERMFTEKIRSLCSTPDLSIHNFQKCGDKVPDLLLLSKEAGNVFWLEAKVINSSGVKIPFEKGQVEWLLRWTIEGGKAAVAVYNNSTHFPLFIPFLPDRFLAYKLKPITYLLACSLAFEAVGGFSVLAQFLEEYVREKRRRA